MPTEKIEHFELRARGMKSFLSMLQPRISALCSSRADAAEIMAKILLFIEIVTTKHELQAFHALMMGHVLRLELRDKDSNLMVGSMTIGTHTKDKHEFLDPQQIIKITY